MMKGIALAIVRIMISFELVACVGGTAQAAWQDMVCKPNETGMGAEHFMVNFKAKKLRSGDKVLAEQGGTPRDWNIIDLVITNDVIKFKQKLDLGGTVLISKWSINRKDGAYIRNDDSKNTGQCLVNNNKTF